MALTAEEEELLKVARETLPALLVDDRLLEDLIAFAKIHGPGLTVIRDWLATQALITTAENRTIDGGDGHTLTPDWLNQHARDRDTSRAKDESNAQLRNRIRLQPVELTGGTTIDPSDAVTRRALLDNAKLILDGAGQSSLFSTLALVELPRDGAFMNSWGGPSGTGGTFYKNGTTVTFVPTVKFPYAPWQKTAPDASADATGTVPDPTLYPFGDPEVPPDGVSDPGSEKTKSGSIASYRISISGAASAGNDGLFVTTGLGSGPAQGDGVQFTNAAGVAGADAGAFWSLDRIPAWGTGPIDVKSMSFLSRGDRIAGPGATVLLIVGYIANPTARSTVKRAMEEMLRAKAGAGVRRVVEMRANP